MRIGPALIPTELWQYSLGDLLRSLRLAASTIAPFDAFPLPEFGECAPVRSGRAGIVLALRVLDMRPGARVGVPLYCCPVVFKAIVAAGCVPRFIDVDPETFCLSTKDLAAKQQTIDALVAVHMFGNTCDMPALHEVMAGRPIIEDCAQSLGTRLNGRSTGAFGDISVFSFRS
jgi:perosamine synthetase